jgi:subtilisin family serine protease
MKSPQKKKANRIIKKNPLLPAKDETIDESPSQSRTEELEKARKEELRLNREKVGDDAANKIRVIWNTIDLPGEAIPDSQYNHLGLPLSERPRFTGHQLVVLNPEINAISQEKIAGKASLRMANIRDFTNPETFSLEATLKDADGLIFDKLNVALISSQNNGKLGRIMASTEGSRGFLMREPERFIYSLSTSATPLSSMNINNSPAATWGIHAINAIGSQHTGRGIRVAILDSGFITTHPSFVGKKIVTKSFLEGNSSAEDEFGHGTMCAGIACGLRHDQYGYQFGVAHDAEIYIGRVLDKNGTGRDGDLLQAIQWAMDEGCKVISMSVGGANLPGERFSPAFEMAAATGLKEGTLLVAAAGNESNRQYGLKSPVVHPANCPSIMAVQAVDGNCAIYNFGCSCMEEDGGRVDIAAPGVDIISSWLPTQNYTFDTGTSLATPFVAGIAALYWEADPAASAAEIWLKLIQTARRLPYSSADVGAGLVYYKNNS